MIFIHALQLSLPIYIRLCIVLPVGQLIPKCIVRSVEDHDRLYRS